MVLGPPGSGKSTLACRLGVRHALPVFHLDRIHWRPNWVAAAPDEFRRDVERIARGSAWIIDGNYAGTIAPRLLAADTIIYLDIPPWLSLVRILRRGLADYGHVRPDAAPGCPERLSPSFLRFAWHWNRTHRARTLAIVDGFTGRKVVLRTRTEARRFAED